MRLFHRLLSPKKAMRKPEFSGKQVGPYLLTDLLGAGVSGSVYRAVFATSKHPTSVAVKCLPKLEISRERGVQLVTEIFCHDTATGCPHVLKLRDIIEDDRYVYLVLDLCETDMFKAIWREKVYWRNDDLIRKAFIEILDGVSACHRRRIFHRDLKPENIMCKADGTGIQIADFGWATHHRLCRDGGCGTPYYMSPECWTFDENDPYYSIPIDTWSLGVILFNMVTNHYPWDTATPSDKDFEAFIDNEDHLFHTSPISEQLNVLLKWMLHPIPSERLPIPAIRQAILELDTFYKWHHPFRDDSPFSKEVDFTDSEQTCVEPGVLLNDKKKYGVLFRSQYSDSLEPMCSSDKRKQLSPGPFASALSIRRAQRPIYST